MTDVADKAGAPLPIWCVVANVADQTRSGPISAPVVRSGTKHFSAGTKVYCFPPLWGDGYEHIKVLGKHRGSRRLVEMVTEFRHLTNWRAKLVYDPRVISALAPHWDGSVGAKATAEGIAQWGEASRTCAYCQINQRNVDLAGWWVVRRWSTIVFIAPSTRDSLEVQIVSIFHRLSGEWPWPNFAANFQTNVHHVASILTYVLGVIPQHSATKDQNGHLQTTLTVPEFRNLLTGNSEEHPFVIGKLTSDFDRDAALGLYWWIRERVR